MDNSLIYFRKNFNCYFLTLRGILTRKVGDVSLLWYQAAMTLYEKQGKMVFSPYFSEISRQLLKVYNIKEYYLIYEDYKEFTRSISTIISNGGSILLFCDVYDLPHTLYYKKIHIDHAIEVYKIIDDRVYYVDHYYKYEGYIDNEIFNQICKHKSRDGKKDVYSFRFYDTSKFKYPEIKSYLLKAIYENYCVLNGKSPYSEMLLKDQLFGIAAMEKFIEIIKFNVFETHEDVNVIFQYLNEFGNSRKHFGEILKNYGHLLPSLGKMATHYELVANSAHVVANMILKSHIMQKPCEYKERVIKKLDDILIKEKFIKGYIGEIFLSLKDEYIKANLRIENY